MMILDLDDMTLFVESVTDGFTSLETILPEELASSRRDIGLGINDLDGGQIMPLRDFEVERIVRWSYLDGPGSKLEVNAFVRDDGDLPNDQRKSHRLAD